MSEIRTCSLSLLTPGTCCREGCDREADFAALDDELVEHAVCEFHSEHHDTTFIATKPMLWSDAWGPTCP